MISASTTEDSAEQLKRARSKYSPAGEKDISKTPQTIALLRETTFSRGSSAVAMLFRLSFNLYSNHHIPSIDTQFFLQLFCMADGSAEVSILIR